MEPTCACGRHDGVSLRFLIAYIVDDSPDDANFVQDRLEKAIERLTAQPGMGRPGCVSGTRTLIVGGTSYIIPDRVRGREVQLAAMMHAKQQRPGDIDWIHLWDAGAGWLY